LFEFKEDEDFNHPRGIYFAFHGAGRHTLSISRIKLKHNFVQTVELYPREIGCAFHRAGIEVGQKGGLKSLMNKSQK